MTLEIAFLFALLAVMVALFLTERLPVEVTAFSGLAVLVFAGYLGPAEAFTGFSSPAVITMLSVFLLSGGLQQTGVAEMLGGRLHALGRGREVPLMVVIMLVAGGLSAFMNNVAATAVLLPAVASICRRAGIAPSRLFIPLAFGAILGGTTTLIGTPPNILAAEVLVENDLPPFELFDFAPLGLVLLGTGVLFMITVGRRLLPERSPRTTGPAGGDGDLPSVYRLHERLFSVQVPEGSPLDGTTLSESRLGTALRIQVVALVRSGRRRLAPDPDTELRGGDVLLVEGKLDELSELLELQGVEVEATPPRLTVTHGAADAARLRLTDPSNRIRESALLGRTLREVAFRQRFGVVVARIERDGTVITEELATTRLRAGDELLAVGTPERLDEVASAPEVDLVERGPAVFEHVEQGLFLLRVPPDAPLVGSDLRSARLGELVGLTVVGLMREGETRLAVESDEPIHGGDRLLASGEPSRILALLQIGDLELEGEAPADALESERVGVVEAVVAPRSKVEGKTLAELAFRERYGLQVLAVWRGGRAIRRGLAHLALRIGEALLLQGPREKIDLLASDPDFVVLSDRVRPPRRVRKAPFALAALALMVGLVVTHVQPIQVAAFTAAVVVLLSRSITMEEGHRFIEWKAIFLAVGIAMERTGAALLLAETAVRVAGGLGPVAVLGVLAVLSSLLSQGLDGAPTVVLLGPVVIHTAEQLQVSPYPLLMAVSLAASAAFMTPFSHKANLLVMGAGSYRASDYLRIGTPLTVVVLLLLTFLVPLVFPF